MVIDWRRSSVVWKTAACLAVSSASKMEAKGSKIKSSSSISSPSFSRSTSQLWKSSLRVPSELKISNCSRPSAISLNSRNLISNSTLNLFSSFSTLLNSLRD
ncbi:unnamed protein product [Caenorhabditis nigoni]